MEEQHEGRLLLPHRVRARERNYISDRRHAARGELPEGEPETVTDEVGIALSGGGIRSATFSLGALQALAKHGILRLADYMCTVSGGGYMGSCLSSLTTVRKKAPPEKAGYDLHENLPLSTPDQIHHLRSHGDFLIIRKGLFRREVLRVVGHLPLGIVCSFLFFASLMLLVGGIFVLGMWFLGGDRLLQLAHDGKAFRSFSEAMRTVAPTGKGIAVALSVGAVWSLLLHLAARLWPPEHDELLRTETRQEYSERRWLWVYGFAVVAGIVLAALIASDRVRALRPSQDQYSDLLWGSGSGTAFPNLILPAFAAAGTLIMAWILFIAAARRDSGVWTQSHRSIYNAMKGVSTYAVIGSLGMAALAVGVIGLNGEVAVSGSSGGIALIATRLLAKRGGSGEKKEKSAWKRLLSKSPSLLLNLAVAAFIVVSLLLAASFLLRADWPAEHRMWVPLVIGAVAFAAIGTIVDFNRISPHYFYLDRLVETYLQTEASKQEGRVVVRDDADMKVAELHDRRCTPDGESSDINYPNAAPYHLFLCAVNLPGSRDLARRDRKSDHFIFSRYYCGCTTTGYIGTQFYQGGQTELSRVMTISGAAAASAMGFHTSFARAFALTLFNIRLGFWLPNPAIYKEVEGAPGRRLPTERRKARSQFDKPLARDQFAFWPAYLLREMGAAMDASGRRINLSDGGHTGDNIGIYPLLQRRCKLIIACDGERDPKYTFGSLVSAIRQIYTDENVIVDFDIDEVRPDEPGKPTKRHYVIGRIRYPACDAADSERAADDPDLQRETGWLLYIKSSLRGLCEPAAVKSYAADHEDFPHQSTADPFFDDNQFEAYRALGEHIAQHIAWEIPRVGSKLSTTDIVTWCKSQFNQTKSQVVHALASHLGDEKAAADELETTEDRLEELKKQYGLL